jgi:hypothetical protein
MPVPVSSTAMATSPSGLSASTGDSRCRADGDRQPPLACHSIARVDRDIDQCGFELADIRIDEQWLVRQMRDDFDGRSCQRADDVTHRVHALADIEHFRLQRLTSCKGQQLRRQLGGAIHCFGDRCNVACTTIEREIGPLQQID